METMQFQIAQMGLFFRVLFFPIKVISQNNLSPIRRCLDGARSMVVLYSRLIKNVHDVTNRSKTVLHLWILFCYLCFVSGMLSCLFIAALW